MRTLLILLLVLFSSLLTAKPVEKSAKSVAKVESLVGSVRVKHEGSFRKKVVKVGLDIKEGDLLSTSKESSLVLHLLDKSIVVVDASSAIYFGVKQSLEHKKGKVFYKITSRNAKNALAIKTPFAIIGIKGTTFVIDAKKKSRVALKEGLIGVTSLEDNFELHIKKEKEDFSTYMNGEQKQFKQYQIYENKYTVKYIKEFDLKSGNRLSFDGKKVKEDKLNNDDKEEFSYFEKLISPKK